MGRLPILNRMLPNCFCAGGNAWNCGLGARGVGGTVVGVGGGGPGGNGGLGLVLLFAALGLICGGELLKEPKFIIGG